METGRESVSGVLGFGRVSLFDDDGEMIVGNDGMREIENMIRVLSELGMKEPTEIRMSRDTASKLMPGLEEAHAVRFRGATLTVVADEYVPAGEVILS